MKKIYIAVFALCSFTAKSQKNTLLDQGFWKNQPNVEAVKAEVAKGNNPLEFNRMTMDPIAIAINSGAANETVKFLLSQSGVDVNRLTHEGRTYLHWAAFKGNVEIMEELINKGAKVNIPDVNETTPLCFAAMGGLLTIQGVELLVKGGANLKKEVNRDGANVLLLAVTNDKDLTLTNYFISKGLDIKSVDKNDNTIFSYAARGGNINTLKALIQKGVAVSDNALIMAAQGRRGPANTIEVFEYLESLNIKPTVTSKNGENVLHFIVRKPNQKDIIEHFLSKGVDVNQADNEGNTVFMNAVSSNKDLAILELLAAKVKNVNQGNQKLETPLALALKGNSSEVVKFLLDKGADVKATNKDGENVLAYLVQSYAGAEGRQGPNSPKPEDFDNKLKMLQEKGLSATTLQKNGNTLYHLAIMKSDIGLLKRIQPLGIDINARNSEGITALHKAAMIAKDDTILKYLLSVGADKNVVTNFKETAFDLASENETLSKSKISINFLK
jgi:ankyrin repeat protein